MGENIVISQTLKGKNIVLVCPDFYGYENEIREVLQRCGAKVTTIIENIEWTSLFFQIVFRFFPEKKESAVKRYYLRKLNGVIQKCDYFFVIRGSSLNPDIMEYAKQEAPSGCRFIMYQWDSVSRDARLKNVTSYFDSVATFDPVDAEKYGWHYRPLFFIDKYIQRKPERIYDILYICSAHSKRVQVLQKLKKTAADRNLKIKAILHMSIPMYLKHKYTPKGISDLERMPIMRKDVTLRAINLKKCYELYSDAKIVVDYTHPLQTGLTMRTIESLGNGCKLITNNRRIEEADFYDERNILVYDDCDLEIPESFLQEPFIPVTEEIYDKYSIEFWVLELLSE